MSIDNELLRESVAEAREHLKRLKPNKGPTGSDVLRIYFVHAQSQGNHDGVTIDGVNSSLAELIRDGEEDGLIAYRSGKIFTVELTA